MKTKLTTAEHSVNGLSLFVVPETAEERALLRGLWKHGKLEKCNGIADNTGEGFAISWNQEVQS